MSQIPSWVYLAIIALLYMGYKNCFKRVLRVKMLILLPAVFVWLSVSNLFKAEAIIPSHVISYIVGGGVGLYLGYLHAKKTRVRADKHQHLIELPGDWTIFLLIIVIFAVQFAIHYLLASDAEVHQQGGTMALIYMISGITTGIVVGRNLTYFGKFTNAHHEHLQDPKAK